MPSTHIFVRDPWKPLDSCNRRRLFALVGTRKYGFELMYSRAFTGHDHLRKIVMVSPRPRLQRYDLRQASPRHTWKALSPALMRTNRPPSVRQHPESKNPIQDVEGRDMEIRACKGGKKPLFLFASIVDDGISSSPFRRYDFRRNCPLVIPGRRYRLP